MRFLFPLWTTSKDGLRRKGAEFGDAASSPRVRDSDTLLTIRLRGGIGVSVLSRHRLQILKSKVSPSQNHAWCLRGHGYVPSQPWSRDAGGRCLSRIRSKKTFLFQRMSNTKTMSLNPDKAAAVLTAHQPLRRNAFDHDFNGVFIIPACCDAFCGVPAERPACCCRCSWNWTAIEMSAVAQTLLWQFC